MTPEVLASLTPEQVAFWQEYALWKADPRFETVRSVLWEHFNYSDGEQQGIVAMEVLKALDNQ